MRPCLPGRQLWHARPRPAGQPRGRMQPRPINSWGGPPGCPAHASAVDLERQIYPIAGARRTQGTSLARSGAVSPSLMACTSGRRKHALPSSVTASRSRVIRRRKDRLAGPPDSHTLILERLFDTLPAHSRSYDTKGRAVTELTCLEICTRAQRPVAGSRAASQLLARGSGRDRQRCLRDAAHQPRSLECGGSRRPPLRRPTV